MRLGRNTKAPSALAFCPKNSISVDFRRHRASDLVAATTSFDNTPKDCVSSDSNLLGASFPWPGPGDPPSHWLDKDRPFLALESKEIPNCPGQWQLLGAMGASSLQGQNEDTDLFISPTHRSWKVSRLKLPTTFQFETLVKLQYNSDYFKLPPFGEPPSQTPQLGGLLLRDVEAALTVIYSKANIPMQLANLAAVEAPPS